jgi:hypothetical protein
MMKGAGDMQAWEYKVVYGHDSKMFDGGHIQMVLDEHGNEGWELVNLVYDPRYPAGFLIFKRQKQKTNNGK